MPVTTREYGAHVGKPNQDLRVILFGPGQKNALSVTFSYNIDPILLVGPPLTGIPFTEADFWGRIVVFEGDTLPDQDIRPDGTPVAPAGAGDVFENPLRRYLDIVVHSPGPHSFLIPIAQQEGGIQTSSGGTLQAVLTLGIAGAGEHFTPRLTIAGQTIVKAV